jgi:hypothetical protein
MTDVVVVQIIMNQALRSHHRAGLSRPIPLTFSAVSKEPRLQKVQPQEYWHIGLARSGQF